MRRFVRLMTLFLASCSLSSVEERAHEEGTERVGAVTSALSDADPLGTAVTEACTTSVVKGLSTQLVEEMQCLKPGTFASMENAPGLDLGSAVFPYLQVPAQAALLKVQRERGVTMKINSALRTLPQQYLLYRWYKTGRCSIGLAATPGTSNHEEGLAVDVDDNAAWRTAMKNHSFVWLGSSDPVHYDFKGEGAADIGGLSVLAFQRLWNRNHPEDPIDENSTYETKTEQRLSKAPIGGFAKGANCATEKGTSAPVATAPDASVPAVEAGSGEPTSPRTQSIGDTSGCAMSRRTPGPPAVLGVVAALVLLRIRRRRAR